MVVKDRTKSPPFRLFRSEVSEDHVPLCLVIHRGTLAPCSRQVADADISRRRIFTFLHDVEASSRYVLAFYHTTNNEADFVYKDLIMCRRQPGIREFQLSYFHIPLLTGAPFSHRKAL